RPLVPALRFAALVLVAVAAARPQMASAPQSQTSNAVDVMLVLDVSSSMSSPDFQPLNRLEAAKQVIERFVAGREFDRLGLIAFARYSFLKCPLTLDHPLLLS